MTHSNLPSDYSTAKSADHGSVANDLAVLVGYKLTDETIRDLFAAAAMIGIMKDPPRPHDTEDTLAEKSYILADAMMNARKK